jgi:hypothetical protein
VLLAADLVVVDLGPERRFDLTRSAAKSDTDPERRRRIDREALRGQPGRRARDVSPPGAEARGEVLRGEPLVVARGRRILHRSQERLAIGELFGRRLKE